jgi:hypothetical protein
MQTLINTLRPKREHPIRFIKRRWIKPGDALPQSGKDMFGSTHIVPTMFYITTEGRNKSRIR